MQRIIIFANGELPNLEKARALLRNEDLVICADGGTRHASALAIKPDLVIGDMDSTEKSLMKKLRDEGVAIELFPRDKNETDLELAIVKAIELAPKEILIVAALGGRLDQTLANIALLSDIRLAAFDVRIDDGVDEILFCRGHAEVHGRSGDIVSLIPWGLPVDHVQTKGLRWALTDETLHPEKTRGVSNEMLGNSASIEFGAGNLLVIHSRKS